MSKITIAIIIISVLALLLFFKKGKGKKSKKQTKWLAGAYSEFFEKHLKKESNIQEVLDLFEHHSELTNNKIRNLTGFSDRAVVNYLDELEKQGKIEQVGRTGRGVYYKIKK